MQTLAKLASDWEWILIGIILLIVILLIVIFFVLRRANKHTSLKQDSQQPHEQSALARSPVNPHVQRQNVVSQRVEDAERSRHRQGISLPTSMVLNVG